MQTPHDPLAGDRGQAVVFAVLVLFLAVSSMLVLARVGAAAIDRAAAQTAADAAALAAVDGGRDAAVAAAAANRGVVRRYLEWDGVVEVVVRVGDADAVARASRAGGPGGILAP